MLVRTKSLIFVLSFAILLSSTDFSSAQRRQRGFFSPARVQLVSLEKVQAEIKLADDQKETASKINDEFAESRREIFQSGDREGFREKIEKLNKEINGKLSKTLKDEQKKRLTEIFVQYNGTGALTDADVQTILKIEDEKKKELSQKFNDNRQAMFAAFRESRDLSDEERREKFAKLGEEGDKKMLALLTEDQRKAFKELEGKKIELDLSSLSRRGGRRGQGNNRPQRPVD